MSILKHSNQWVETIDLSIAAMQAMVQSHLAGSVDVFKSIAAHFSEMMNKQQKSIKEVGKQPYHERRGEHIMPEWVYSPPQDLSQSRYFKADIGTSVPNAEGMDIGFVPTVTKPMYHLGINMKLSPDQETKGDITDTLIINKIPMVEKVGHLILMTFEDDNINIRIIETSVTLGRQNDLLLQLQDPIAE